MSNTHIWQVVDSRSYGGIESHIYYLSTALQKYNYKVTVVFIQDYGSHPIEEKFIEEGVNYIKFSGVKDFLKQVSLYKPNIIHSHGYKANIVSRITSKIHRIPVVTSFHAGDAETLRLKLYTWIDKKTAFLNYSIAINEKISKTIFGKSKTIDNFVPIPSLTQYKNKKINIGFVGRLSFEKGPDIYCKIAQSFPNIWFHVFGSGDMEDSLKASAPKNVLFHGHVNNIDKAWKNMDLLCMPSREEGLPMAALEAMAQGIPVLASPVGALPKLINNGQNGWISKVENFEETLQDITDNDLKTCSIQARETIISAYSPHIMVPRFIELYTQIMCTDLEATHHVTA